MYSSQSKPTLLLPVKGWFIWLTLALALLLNLTPLGRVAWMPDWLAVVLLFWCVQQPTRMGMSVAFGLGLVIDVSQSSILGQHALAYALLAFSALVLSRRILWYGALQQAFHVLPLFFAAELVLLISGLLGRGVFPGWAMAWAPLLQAMLWPLVSWLLLAPQRRAPDQDDSRPI